MIAPFVRRASVALAAFTLACGDSTAPKLSEAQVQDMADALFAVAWSGDAAAPGGTSMSASPFGEFKPTSANATVNVSQTVDCPNGGTAGVNGTATSDDAAGTFSATVTQTFTACSATSSQGRVWTFTGNPNIVTSISASSNQTTGAFSMTLTQVGGVKFESDLGAGACAINLTYTLSGNQTSLSASLNGSACGRNISQTINVTQ